ncbi:MAG: 2-iminoacetate synthase ThiH [Arcticibacter sp.]
MFKEIFNQYHWEHQKADILNKTSKDVESALTKEKLTIDDFKALVSPAALPFLEQMAQKSQRLTQKRFGKTLQMYIPMYLSNECQNICTYCAFSLDNKISRKTLSTGEILREADIIKSMGYDHILLVTGEANLTVGVPYLKKTISILKPFFSSISLEVQPLEETDYSELIKEGLNTVLVYQETYNRERYKVHHPKGKKSNFDYRLDTPDRLGKAEVHKIGLGTLIGLEDWRTDCFFTALHLQYLERTYWKTKFSVSFPRLRPIQVGGDMHSYAPGPKNYMNDRELVQLICAWRLFNENLEISISTREEPSFRDNIISLGITSISAGSRTNPGGYSSAPDSLEQFEISDDRSAAEIAEVIRRQGYEPVWKDWDQCYS